ncbi:MAG: chemotaxis protein CheC [Anaerolineae bacterium]|nr:chemotaxis protein CheC [Anaerolineae bacterium]
MPTKLNAKQINLWSKLISSASPESMLAMAMRHTAHNLADMVDRPISIDNLCIETLPISRLTGYADNPEAETVGIYLLIDEELSGEAMLILSQADAMYLADWLLQARPGTTTRLGELECSALAEFGNLTLSAFLNAVAEFTGTPLRLSPPAVMVDMLATVFEAVAMSAGSTVDELMIVKTEFMNVDSDLSIQFWVMPNPAVYC